MNDDLAAEVEAIRALYTEKIPGYPFPQWGKFDREYIGKLLAAYDALRTEVARLSRAVVDDTTREQE